MFKMEEPKPGEIYEHFKGKDRLYRIQSVSRSCDNPETKNVNYVQLYEGDEFPEGTVWHRTLEDFCGEKELNGKKVKRFTRVEG